MRVFTASTRRFQRAPSRNPGPRNGGTGTKSGQLRPSFDTPGANQRINWEVLELGGEIGTLQPGSCADLCLLRWEGEGSLEDAFGNVVSGGRWEPVLTVRAGEVVHVAPELLSGQPAKL